MKVLLQEDFALPMPLKGRPSDLRREDLELRLERALSGLPKCNIHIARRVVRESIGIHDSDSAIGYIERVKPRVSGLTVQKVADITLVHRDPPSDKLDEDCLRDCAEPLVAMATESQRAISEQDERALENQVNAKCACRCQQASSCPQSSIEDLLLRGAGIFGGTVITLDGIRRLRQGNELGTLELLGGLAIDLLSILA